ncbi:hypothetical protein BDZ89DRAFT_252400 [Hymenopellis radicata]|nr:hypothetical protein BDZ89DRAFT_252400 [Hymenopellis radicata]
MPVDPSTTKLNRKARRRGAVDAFNFDSALAREIEEKRSRGEVSCAECRRLKIKCDKQVPCQSCQRRGCTSLCPNGSLSTGQGTRFVLAATEHLHHKIEKLTARIRQLEDALSKTQSQFSEHPHPLLDKELLDLDSPNEEVELLSDQEDVRTPAQPCDMHGTLSISSHGVSRFFGATGGCESLIIASEDHDDYRSMTPESSQGSLSPTPTLCTPNELATFEQSFPFPGVNSSSEIYDGLLENLPSWERANTLVNSYFGLFDWIFYGIGRDQINELLPIIYRKDSASRDNDYSPHDLSLIFMIFSIGSLAEGEDCFTDEAERFHRMSRTAISLQSLLERPSLVTVQSIHLMSIYNAVVGGNPLAGTTMETTWSLTRLAAQLAYSLGLHRDGDHWGLSSDVVQRRRMFFWDLYVADIWQSLHTGRPPSFDLAYIDCKYPVTNGAPGTDSGVDFGAWQFRFASECVAKVTAQSLTAESPSYQVIMGLDEMVRQYPLPPIPSSARTDVASSWQRFVLGHIRETVLMYIHRNYFAQAFVDDPVNPLKSPYAASVLATYQASSTILKCVSSQFSQWPGACGRFWTMWTFAFSAAVVFGTVVTGGPRSPLAGSAMAELKEACILFSKAAVYSKYAKKALPILAKLNEKAHIALSAAQHEHDPCSHSPERSTGTENDDLLIFGGRTWFLSKHFDAKRSPPPTENDIRLQSPTSTLPPSINHRQVLAPSPNSYSYDRRDSSEYIFNDSPPPRRPQLVLDTATTYSQESMNVGHPHLIKREDMYSSPYAVDQHIHMASDTSMVGPSTFTSDSKLDQWYAFLQSSGAVEGTSDFKF